MIIRIVSAGLLLLAQLPLAAHASTCGGANPAVTSAVVKSVVPSGNVNQYHIQGTVTNLGSQGQADNTLQFVDIYEGASQERLNDRGIPPLNPVRRISSVTFGIVRSTPVKTRRRWSSGFAWCRAPTAIPATRSIN